MLKRSRAKRGFSLKRHLKRQMRGLGATDSIGHDAASVQSHLDFVYQTLQAIATSSARPRPKFRLDLYKVGKDGGINHG